MLPVLCLQGKKTKKNMDHIVILNISELNYGVQLHSKLTMESHIPDGSGLILKIQKQCKLHGVSFVINVLTITNKAV